MHRISKLTHHVVPEGVVYARIADGDYEKSKHKLQGVSRSRLPLSTLLLPLRRSPRWPLGCLSSS